MRRSSTLLLASLLLLSAPGCRPDGATTTTPAPAVEAPPPVDHGPPPPYAGTWQGPSLRLSFAGPWVLVEPVDPPGQVPIELHLTVERREGDAFALRTSIAGVMPSDFLRPTDWTLLVEDGALAIAMGDEPLESYVAVPSDARPETRPLLLGPSLLHELPLPEQLPFAAASSCLELASLGCGALEAEGPRAAGCREALWAACVGHVLTADETPTPGSTGRLVIRTQTALLRFSSGLLAACPDDRRAEANAFHRRTLQAAAAALREREQAGELPSDDPALPRLMAMLAAAVDAGDLDAAALAGLADDPS